MKIHHLVIHETLQRLGVPGLLGIAILAAGIIYGLASVLPARGDLERARLQAVRSQGDTAANTAANGAASPPAPPTAAGQLARFYAALPPQDEATAWLNRIYQAAGKEKLTLARGEYNLQTDADSRIARYQIVMPVRGDYGQIRRFLSAALAGVPHLALEEVSFQRQSIAEAQLEGRIRFTLFLQRRAP